MTSLVDVIRAHAERRPAFRVFSFLDDADRIESYASFQELFEAASRVAAFFQRHAAAGERVLLLLPPGRQFVEGLLGCLLSGAVAVPVHLPREASILRRIDRIAVDSGARWVLTTSDMHEDRAQYVAAMQGLSGLRWVTLGEARHTAGQSWQKPELSSDSLALLQYTSGSTGDPKGVMVSHGNLVDNLERIHQRLGTTQEENALSWLPPYHDMGLIGGVLQPLYVGFHTFLAAPSWFIRRPERWLQRISSERITGSGGPNFAFSLCAERFARLSHRGTLDLGCWRIAFTGAEAVRHQTIERFVAQFAEFGFREESICPLYGMAEATLMISGNGPGERISTARVDREAYSQGRALAAANGTSTARLVGCGASLGDHQVCIVGPQSRRILPDGEVGEIWVAGASVALGYWRRPDLTNEHFRAYLHESSNAEYRGPFLRTGDLGFWQDGQLYISGRLKDTIVIRGRNHYPQDIEETMQHAHPRLRLGRGVAFSVDHDSSEYVAVAHEVTPGEVPVQEIGQAIQQAVALHHNLQVHSVSLLRSRSLPQTSSGKLRRLEVRSAFLRQKLDTIGVWINPRVQRIREAVAPSA